MFKAKIWLTDTTSEDTPSHFCTLSPDKGLFSLTDVIAGPVEILFKGSRKFEVYTTIWWTKEKIPDVKLNQMKLTSLYEWSIDLKWVNSSIGNL